MPVDIEANKACRKMIEALLLSARCEVARLEALLKLLEEVTSETTM